MANLNGANYTSDYLADPKGRGVIGEVGGKVKATFDTFSGAAGADLVTFGRVQAGARILAFGSVGAGTAPTFNVNAGDKLSSDTDMICTLDGDTAASGSIWVEYLLD